MTILIRTSYVHINTQGSVSYVDTAHNSKIHHEMGLPKITVTCTSKESINYMYLITDSI